ncbi:unnamed protein product [Rhizoctonia solani]|uniref:SGNH hydrolase-type esterase domain-containing protein n=1 Tax=Rhizoctonia solani TaxID=456999 RepID=A0A8H3CAH7_9AGAM|nr:unnamed protein product [Rhizoctonia solani]
MRLVAASTAILSLASLAAAAAVPRDEVSDLIAKFIKAESQWKQEWANTSYVLSGDSTTANGQNGATTVSFRNGGRWNLTLESAKSEVANGRKTWVTIQFGHNDMKVMSAEAMGVNLAKFVDEVRGVGAEPILITSLTRRNFNADNVTVNDTLGPWADATIAVSEEKQTHLLDLHKWSMWYVEKIGPDAAHRLNRLPDDNTHLNTNGTTVFGRMVADLMAVKLLPEIGPILPNISLSLPVWTGKAVY